MCLKAVQLFQGMSRIGWWMTMVWEQSGDRIGQEKVQLVCDLTWVLYVFCSCESVKQLTSIWKSWWVAGSQ